ncbi:putative deacetylase LmbE-like domain-containing protein [Aspergillus pseudonomiae]|uniref:N-acetylglucosaminylphosphatidylinositol deacetylase n=1 Tax=Aspergillus pseudonomiae TaxID=1506151 RepID=A0A5N7D6R0_9EURO|nr:putative deacetylase LmbE-like domain-containing protein [Aspergillus pseudonomiae]KAE8402112.1 putative deacetylase LmbE-like domain-containing protein [Aspergillus pseudonomiae]
MRASFLLAAIGFLDQLPCSAAQTLNIVAHQDDDLLFLSPDILHEVQAGRRVRTVFLTAGDAGEVSTGYWEQRQAGSQAAYAQMADVSDIWTQSDAGIDGKNIPAFTLAGNPDISLVFLQLPDGNGVGDGFPNTGSASLQKLWQSEISSIQTVNGSTSYTNDELIDTLASLMSDFSPDRINTQDYTHEYGGGDHSDHYTTAYYVQQAAERYSTTHTLTGYTGYPIQSMAQNVFGDDLQAKQSAFFTYAAHDSKVCHDVASCVNARLLDNRRTVGLEEKVVLDGTESRHPNGDSLTDQWTQIRGADVALSDATAAHPSFTSPKSSETLGFCLVVGSGKTRSTPAEVTVVTTHLQNVARNATAIASSHDADHGQTAGKALDSISEVYLYDRPNVNEQVTGGILQFDDDSTIPVGALDNYGKLNRIPFRERTTRSLFFMVTSLSPSTRNVGLAER